MASTLSSLNEVQSLQLHKATTPYKDNYPCTYSLFLGLSCLVAAGRSLISHSSSSTLQKASHLCASSAAAEQSYAEAKGKRWMCLSWRHACVCECNLRERYLHTGMCCCTETLPSASARPRTRRRQNEGLPDVWKILATDHFYQIILRARVCECV